MKDIGIGPFIYMTALGILKISKNDLSGSLFAISALRMLNSAPLA